MFAPPISFPPRYAALQFPHATGRCAAFPEGKATKPTGWLHVHATRAGFQDPLEAEREGDDWRATASVRPH
jgi:hypothetical protein